ncbi:hypothetical protein Mapa_007341 [Marchantia paleacea]|nr:hypothetical protein Mapa_007341 [Marchantia paleacea]
MQSLFGSFYNRKRKTSRRNQVDQSFHHITCNILQILWMIQFEQMSLNDHKKWDKECIKMLQTSPFIEIALYILFFPDFT